MTEPLETPDETKVIRRRLDPDTSRELILDAAERLMRGDGYRAITVRRVATEAGLKAPLVHYYYRTTDDLLLAFYRRSTGRTRMQIDDALASTRPLRALWDLISDPARAALAAEFMALANHRKVIRTEMAKNITNSRASQSKAVAHALASANPDGLTVDPTIATVLLASISYGLILESQVGATAGHAETRAFVEMLIARFEQPSPPAAVAGSAGV